MTVKEKVLVAMSGGVDSAVSAILLKEAGYDVVGVNLRLWEYEKHVTECDIEVKAKSCCSPEDISDAGFVAQRIGIPFYVIKMENEFRERVIQDFIDAYVDARTPNPCVNCNTFVKFGELFRKAKQLGIKKIATGHYARIVEKNGRYSIQGAVDTGKNQAYYLYGLSQEALKATIFPLGEMKKSEARKIAAEHGLPIASKPESQDICFIPDNDYRRFLKSQGVQFRPGRFLNTQGDVLGNHDGKEKFTIGQRRGLGLSHPEPLYVKEIRIDGDVVVATAAEMGENEFFIEEPNFMLFDPAARPEDARAADGLSAGTRPVGSRTVHGGLVQIRSRHKPVDCTFELTEKDGKPVVKVRTRYPEPAITPGQSAVIYESLDDNGTSGADSSPAEAESGSALARGGNSVLGPTVTAAPRTLPGGQIPSTGAGAVLLGGLIAKES